MSKAKAADKCTEICGGKACGRPAVLTHSGGAICFACNRAKVDKAYAEAIAAGTHSLARMSVCLRCPDWNSTRGCCGSTRR